MPRTGIGRTMLTWDILRSWDSQSVELFSR